MKDRTNEEGIDPAGDKPVDEASRPDELERPGGGRHGAPQERTMIEKILDPENLARAWKRVKANKGAPGIDGMTVADFPAFAREHWPRIASAIREGTYRPAPVRRVWIPKPDGSKRPLGIPTVLDRMIQQAVAQVLGPPFEACFSEHSHGYRPGRSALEAVAAMETGWKEGRRHAVECDLKSFFDTVDHDRLMNALKEKVRCRKTLGLIRRYLTAGVELPDGTREATPQGVPQGGPLSPLLANIALDPLDSRSRRRRQPARRAARRAGAARQRAGGTRTQVREVCRRLHRDGEEREGGGKGAGIADAVLRRTAATGGQPRQESRRATEILRVLGLPAQQPG